MSSDDAVYGVQVLFTESPTVRYLTTDDDLSPRLTHELIDQILGTIDPGQIDAESLSFGAGAPPNLAARTLELVGERLHAEVYGLGSFDVSGKTLGGSAP